MTEPVAPAGPARVTIGSAAEAALRERRESAKKGSSYVVVALGREFNVLNPIPLTTMADLLSIASGESPDVDRFVNGLANAIHPEQAQAFKDLLLSTDSDNYVDLEYVAALAGEIIEVVSDRPTSR